ncbi:hypothetical protein [Aureibacter tunicatorum]|uniref:Uncharacterized protein n=1 Tax=Aureibacter tunicatorum TaxID=866807 RepID=A0AAE3XM79_9BACT|nr:hypothetical protein [Aureibacter tunicatorum]MDR6239522.1 hypothetical protein [Aureibacter tunicatorum]
MIFLFIFSIDSFGQEIKSIPEVIKICELKHINGDSVYFLNTMIPVNPQAQNQLSEDFLELAKFNKSKNDVHIPSKAYTSVILTPENKLINFCSNADFNNVDELKLLILNWTEENEIKSDYHLRIVIFFSCLKWN